MGASWQTTITYINYSPEEVTCQTEFLSDHGSPLMVSFAALGTVPSRTDVLPPGGSVHQETNVDLNASLAPGWARATCSGPVQASLLYRLHNSEGAPTAEAGVNATAVPATRFVTFAEQGEDQFGTGVAYANPSAISAPVTFTARDGVGEVLASVVRTLSPGGHDAHGMSELFDLTSFTGSIEVTSTEPIVSLSINFEADPVFSSLPPGELDASPDVPGEMLAPANQAAFNDLFVGKRVATNFPAVYVDFVSPGRFRETRFAVTSTGSYTYRNTGSNTGTLTLNYDDGDRCTVSLTFVSTTAGTATYTCNDGSSGEYDWRLIDIPTGGDDTAETRYNVGDVITTLPTGTWTPDVTSGASFSFSGGNAVISFNNGGYIEEGSYRYTCQSAGGCQITNGAVASGTIVQTSTAGMPEGTQPSFASGSGPGNRTYTVGTAIATLTLPAASGGDGALTYSLAPSVAGLTFSASTRQLTGTPSTAGSYAITYTVTDEDGDTDTLSFTVTVEASDDGGDGDGSVAGGFDWQVDDGNGVPAGMAYVNGRFYVVDASDSKVYAYTESGQRDAAADFDLDPDNGNPVGITYANGRFYVVDGIYYVDAKVFAYTESGRRDAAADFDLDGVNGSPADIVYANARFYVPDWVDDKVYAYTASGERAAAADFDFHADNGFSLAMTYANGRFYVVDGSDRKVYAYTESGERDAAADFDSGAFNYSPEWIAYATAGSMLSTGLTCMSMRIRIQESAMRRPSSPCLGTIRPLGISSTSTDGSMSWILPTTRFMRIRNPASATRRPSSTCMRTITIPIG